MIYSFILFERTAHGNLVRAQADSVDRPFDVNDGSKLDLGSTAKLRTLVTYLEVVADLHDRFGWLDRDMLHFVQINPRDHLGVWALDYLAHSQDHSLPAMLNAAMERKYSASPAEQFFTGGGVHQFENFHPADNRRIVTVREAFAESINLPFIRIMRDVVQHIVFGSAVAATNNGDPTSAQRDEYLTRFADQEGQSFLRRFYAKYHGKNADEMLRTLALSVRPAAPRLAIAYLSVVPDANEEALDAFLAKHLPKNNKVAPKGLYERYSNAHYSLADRGHLVGVHPLELWLVEYLRQQPDASLSQAVAASGEARRESYDWLFRTRYGTAQDLRISSIKEADAFKVIHQSWKRQGYPFDRLVPSYATAIGSSADRPAALAELMGIIVNDGVRMPTMRIGALHFASDTPFETRLIPELTKPERVLPPAITTVIKSALTDVVSKGTARRLGTTLKLSDGSTLAYGGKTGTGDNRFETYGPGGKLVSSRAVSRAGTFVFMLGDRYFGTITAYVTGDESDSFEFTSALPVQVLKSVSPVLERYLGGTGCSTGAPPLVARTTAPKKLQNAPHPQKVARAELSTAVLER